MLVLKDFRKKCEDLINNSQLPIDAVYFVLKDVFNEVADIYNQEIQKEEENKRQQQQEEEQKNEEEIKKDK